MEKEFTLAVVFRNERKQLRRLLKSIRLGLRQSCFQWRILFIDNNSKDISAVILKEWMKNNPDIDARYVHRWENNMGAARQQALELADTDWLGFVDADCFLPEDWFVKAEKITNEVSADTLVVGGQSDYVGNQKWHRYAIWLNDQFPLGKNKMVPTAVDHVPTNNILIRRDAALELGGFDSFFHRVGEDLDFSVRIRKVGKIIFNPNLKLSHKLPVDQNSWDKKMRLYGEAQMQVLLKNRGGVTGIKFLPLLFPLFSYAILAAVLYLRALPNFMYVVIAISFVVFVFPASRFFSYSLRQYGSGELSGLFKYFLPKKKNLGSSSLIRTEK